jgi:hypothetical protein
VLRETSHKDLEAMQKSRDAIIGKTPPEEAQTASPVQDALNKMLSSTGDIAQARSVLDQARGADGKPKYTDKEKIDMLDKAMKARDANKKAAGKTQETTDEDVVQQLQGAKPSTPIGNINQLTGAGVPAQPFAQSNMGQFFSGLGHMFGGRPPVTGSEGSAGYRDYGGTGP